MPPKKPVDPDKPAKPRATRHAITADPPLVVLARPEPKAPEPKAPPKTNSANVPQPSAAPITSVDIELFSRNVARIVEEGGKALAAYLKPREEGQVKGEGAEEVSDAVKTLGHVAQYWLSDPQRALELQTSLGKSFLDLWAAGVRRLTGEETPPVATPDPADRRFSDPEWTSNQYFDFLKQAYLLT